ncbi:hypothetical protein WH95_19820 [Kiloniella litopenaei]|uniref:Uncharacterized protein n=1 Tax=Kiloniella litopenaei TaxID=1549748 RepID=A0A0M2R5C6_9PROT|nr:hypothetical protein WH95_19820 [Kiloniella litopenaei]
MDYWTLGALSDCDQVLSVCCAVCGHKNHIDPDVLLEHPKYTPFMYVYDIKSRIKCCKCGSKESSVFAQDRQYLGCWNPDPEKWEQADIDHLREDAA